MTLSAKTVELLEKHIESKVSLTLEFYMKLDGVRFLTNEQRDMLKETVQGLITIETPSRKILEFYMSLCKSFITGKYLDPGKSDKLRLMMVLNQFEF